MHKNNYLHPLPGANGTSSWGQRLAARRVTKSANYKSGASQLIQNSDHLKRKAEFSRSWETDTEVTHISFHYNGALISRVQKWLLTKDVQQKNNQVGLISSSFGLCTHGNANYTMREDPWWNSKKLQYNNSIRTLNFFVNKCVVCN
jgi:hypothetical protein